MNKSNEPQQKHRLGTVTNNLVGATITSCNCPGESPSVYAFDGDTERVGSGTPASCTSIILVPIFVNGD